MLHRIQAAWLFNAMLEITIKKFPFQNKIHTSLTRHSFPSFPHPYLFHREVATLSRSGLLLGSVAWPLLLYTDYPAFFIPWRSFHVSLSPPSDCLSLFPQCGALTPWQAERKDPKQCPNKQACYPKRHASDRYKDSKNCFFFCVWLYFWNIMLKNNNKIKTMPLGSDRFVCLFPSNSLFWCWLK